MKKVDKYSPIPLYYQLKTILTELIENEELKPGDLMPTERELCEVHEVSRMTVNKTITSLVNEGVVYRERGKGTFVAKAKEKHHLTSLLSFTEDMQKKGMDVNSKIISFQRKPATKKLEKELKLTAGNTDVFKIMRLRCCGGEPYALETVYIAAYLCNELDAPMLENNSLYGVLNKVFSRKVDYAYQTIEPIMLSDYESEVLQVDRNSLALLFARKTYLKNDVPIEVTKSIYRSDRYKFEIELHR